MKGKNIIIILTFLFLMICVSETVSAANLTINPGNNIQTAVDNASTGDTIIVNDNNGSVYTYTENIVITKNITLKASSDTVSIQASDSLQPVLTVNNGGDGSSIDGFTITGANNSIGILLENVNECTIKNNNINGNLQGIYLLQSSYNSIFNNTISNNTYGIFIPAQCSYDTNIISNYIISNDYGVFSIFQCFNMHFNRIIENNYAGLWFEGEELCDLFYAENNWWGSNSPVYDWGHYDPSRSYDIFYNGGLDPWYYEVILPAVRPWLVQKVNVTPTNTNSNSIVTVDITHDSNGADTSSQGHLPDGIPINFTTNLGTITTTAYTSNGKANVTFSRGIASSGTASVTATLDGQSVQTNITITSSDTIAPIVTANLAGGTYNTYQNITLTATDNTDPDPHIYYTINGSNPTTTSTLYVGPILIENRITTLKFMAMDFTGNQSPIQTKTYRLNLPVENANTTKVYATIQEAIDDPLTVNGHLLYLAETIPTENIILNKKLTLTPDCEGVTLRAADPSKPVLTVTALGSGSWIRYLWITAATNSAGIYLDSAYNCKIEGNYIISNSRGIYLSKSSGNRIISNYVRNNQEGLSLFNSSNNNITSNSITDNTHGIFIPAECTKTYSSFSLNNTITQNKIKNNHYGIYLLGDWSGISAIGGMNTIDTSIISNIISGNVYGVYSNSSQFNMHFNQLNNNNISDLWLEVIEGIRFDAKNNWWGSNQILMDYSDYSVPTTPMDIFCHGFVLDAWYWAEAVSCVTPWLVLNTNAIPTNTYNNSIVTADLTHNSNGIDTSSQGHVPNGIPINFTTDLGTITPTAYTNNGKANASFSRGTAPSGTSTVTATLDGQSVQTNITINNADSTAPTVTASLAGGIYNTTKSMTLTASDNLDLNPIVYYSLNNGTTWSNQVKTVTLNLNQGVTNLKFYARDATGNTCSNQTLSYTIDMTAPTVVANPASGTYNTTKSVTLTATDNLDPNPNIYYTTNGSTPTISSIRYTGPINVVNTITLKFMVVDAAGNQSPVQSQDYIINTQCQMHIHKFFSEPEYQSFEGIDPYFYNTYVRLDTTQQIPLNESGNWVTITINQQFEEPLFMYSGISLRKVYLSNIHIYVDDVQVLSKQFINGCSLQPSWYWARHIDSNLLDYFPEYAHSSYGSRDFVGYDLPYIYRLNSAYTTGDTARFNQIWQTIYNDANITAGDIYFIQHHWRDFQNSLHINFDYPGGSMEEVVQVTYVNDPGSNFEYINLFPIATVKVNDDRYCSIQAAIDSSKTKDGDIIYVNSGIYTYAENIIVNKKVTISASDSAVVIEPLDSSKPVFTITSTGSGSIINSFNITKYTCTPGILLNSTHNCTITGNSFTLSKGIILLNSNYNTIWDNFIMRDNSGGISLTNSSHNLICGNTISRVIDADGICLINYSVNNTISRNDIEYNCGLGIFVLTHSSAQIYENKIKNNGICISNSLNNKICGNYITNGYYGTGISLYNSSAEIHFNQFSGNFNYGLEVSNNSTVNATNNWWGNNIVNYINSTTIPSTSYNIWNKNSTVFYDPWLVLAIDTNSSTNSGGNTSITADLTHNNHGEDTSSHGHIPNDIPVNFATNFGTIVSSTPTLKGKATTILNLGTTQSRTVIVSASLDNQNVSTQAIISPGAATINITSSALDLSTGHPINLTYTVPLNSSVTWISALWKNTYVFYGELDLIVNGVIVESEEFVNPAYITWKDVYRDDVFRAILYINNLLPQIGLNPDTTPNFWTDTATRYSLTSAELQFVQDNYLDFTDNLNINIAYPGVVAPSITITDPLSNNIINLKFTGNVINRCSQILYMDGGLGTAGYEGVKSFAIATTQVTDEIAQYWADQKNATDPNGNLLYPTGAMKAAYGTFFTSLLTIYCHDILADAAASEFHVTWSRTHPVAVSVGDDPYQTYLTLECDHSMGMNSVGTLTNMTWFNYACSSSISIIEYGIMKNLELDYQYTTITDGSITSVTRDMLNAFWTGTNMEILGQDGYIIYKLVGRDDLFQVFDPETGIIRDLMVTNTINGYYGAYCFHKQITESAYDFFGGLKNDTIAYRDWAQESIDNWIEINVHLSHPGMRWNWENELMLIVYAEGAYFSGLAVAYTWPIALTGPEGAMLWGGEVVVFSDCFIGFINNLYNPPWVPA